MHTHLHTHTNCLSFLLLTCLPSSILLTTCPTDLSTHPPALRRLLLPLTGFLRQNQTLPSPTSSPETTPPAPSSPSSGPQPAPRQAHSTSSHSTLSRLYSRWAPAKMTQHLAQDPTLLHSVPRAENQDTLLTARSCVISSFEVSGPSGAPHEACSPCSPTPAFCSCDGTQ